MKKTTINGSRNVEQVACQLMFRLSAWQKSRRSCRTSTATVALFVATYSQAIPTL